jgi:hypothetical protein
MTTLRTARGNQNTGPPRSLRSPTHYPIHAAANTGVLKSMTHGAMVLWRWSEWESPEAVRNWVTTECDNVLFVCRFAHRRGRQHNLSELVQPLLLFLVQELGVTNNVDEQDMSDLNLYVRG